MARQSFRASSGDANELINLPRSADDLPDEVEVDMSDLDIEIVDDTPENDRGRPTAYEPDTALDDQIDDLRSMGKKKIESRIKRLSFERETERRAKEEAQRQLEAAVEAARVAQAEAHTLRQQAYQSTGVLAETMLSRNEMAQQSVRQSLRKAHEDGDTDAMADAQAQISRLAAEEIAIRSRVSAQEQEQPAQQYQPQQAPQAQAPQLPPTVANWVQRNSWFTQPGNQAKKDLALSVHKVLVSRGMDPASNDYIRELDRGIKTHYSDHQSSDDPGSDGGSETRLVSRRPNATADASRTNGIIHQDGRAKFKLTRSQASIADRLGVPREEYVKSLLSNPEKYGAN